ncbi:hypothetical protein HYY72_03295 [Candidatus Woesearchaeota archaeon]|nr:hypothetical protein [Candidatus Woesearchaeota archaeon]
MEVGIKFYSHNRVTEKAIDFADFVEILPVPGNPEGVFPGFRKKYRIHCAHYSFGFNPSNPKARKLNEAIVKEAVKVADELKADRIVVHAGFNSNVLGIREPLKNSLSFLTEFFDRRMCIENLLLVDEDMSDVGYSPGEIAQFTDNGFKFCLDFGHAVATASQLKMDYKDYIGEFVKLKPHYFHLSGTLKGEDKHLSIFEADTDIGFFRGIIRKSGMPVCLETPLDSAVRKKEVEFLKK